MVGISVSSRPGIEQGQVTLADLTTQAKQRLGLTVIPTTQLGDTEFIRARFQIPGAFSVLIWSAGAMNDSENAPAGLEANIVNITGSSTTTLADGNKHEEGDPLHQSAEGPRDMALELRNNTGSQQNASAEFRLTMEDVL